MSWHKGTRVPIMTDRIAVGWLCYSASYLRSVSIRIRSADMQTEQVMECSAVVRRSERDFVTTTVSLVYQLGANGRCAGDKAALRPLSQYTWFHVQIVRCI